MGNTPHARGAAPKKAKRLGQGQGNAITSSILVLHQTLKIIHNTNMFRSFFQGVENQVKFLSRLFILISDNPCF